MKKYQFTPNIEQNENEAWSNTNEDNICEYVCHANTQDEAIELLQNEFSGLKVSEANYKKTVLQTLSTPWNDPNLVTIKELGPSDKKCPCIERA